MVDKNTTPRHSIASSTTSPILQWIVLNFALMFIHQSASAQALKELLESEPYNKISRSVEKSEHQGAVARSKQSMIETHYDSLWHSLKPGVMLLNWIGVRNTGAQFSQTILTHHRESARALTILSNQEHVRVELLIQVPRPQYLAMAEYRTLNSFNRLRPPTLDVVAEQVVPIQGIDAKYYRHRDGACSLLFDVAKLGIVNLYTSKCSDSPVMMKYAKMLDFERLNSKLNS